MKKTIIGNNQLSKELNDNIYGKEIINVCCSGSADIWPVRDIPWIKNEIDIEKDNVNA